MTISSPRMGAMPNFVRTSGSGLPLSTGIKIFYRTRALHRLSSLRFSSNSLFFDLALRKELLENVESRAPAAISAPQADAMAEVVAAREPYNYGDRPDKKEQHYDRPEYHAWCHRHPHMGL